MKYFWICFSLLVFSCESKHIRERILTDDEMQKYHLNGIIHDAEICQHVFDNQRLKLQNTGQCEIVNCEQVKDKIICVVRPKN